MLTLFKRHAFPTKMSLFAGSHLACVTDLINLYPASDVCEAVPKTLF